MKNVAWSVEVSEEERQLIRAYRLATESKKIIIRRLINSIVPGAHIPGSMEDQKEKREPCQIILFERRQEHENL